MNKRVREDGGRGNVPKRPKASQACASCRKHKTRCELLDGDASRGSRCHRCTVLNIACSFSEGGAPSPRSGEPSTSRIPSSISISGGGDEGGYPSRSGSTPTSSTPTASGPPPNIFTRRVPASGPGERVNLLDIVPTPETPWEFMKDPGGHDWTAAPMLAMQSMARRVEPGEPPPQEENYEGMLSSLLTQQQIHWLLQIFETWYAPWLNLTPTTDTHTPLVALARCAIASRHLDHATRSRVTPQLFSYLESILPSLVFRPLPSTESIHALLTLSLWSPVSDNAQSFESRDGRLIIASAVSMAMNLRMGQASVFVSGLRQDESSRRASGAKQAEIDDAADKAKLWLEITTVESALCMGTSRSPLSRRSEHDLELLDVKGNLSSINSDMRLGLMAQIYQLMEEATATQSVTGETFEPWFRMIRATMGKFDEIYRSVAALAVTEPEIFYNHNVQVCYHACRLYVLQHAMRVTRLHWRKQLDGLEGDSSERWFERVRIDGELCAVVLGADAVRAAEAVLISMLAPSPLSAPNDQQQPEIDALSTAPDILFSIVSFAAAQLVMFKFGVLQTTGNILSGVSDHLLDRVVERFRRAALASDHAPAKYGQMISQLVNQWERRSTRGGLVVDANGGLSRQGEDEEDDDDDSPELRGPGGGIGPAVSAERFMPPGPHPGYDVGDVGVMPSPNTSAPSHPLHHHESELPPHPSQQPQHHHQHHPQMMDGTMPPDGSTELYGPYAVDMLGPDIPLMNSDVFLDAGFWAGFMGDTNQNQQM